MTSNRSLHPAEDDSGLRLRWYWMEAEMSKSYMSTPLEPNLARRGGNVFQQNAPAVVTPSSPSAGPTPIRKRQRPVVELPGHDALAILLP